MVLVNHIDEIRSLKHMSLEDIALEANIKPNTLQKIKNQKSNPNILTAFRIVNALNTSIINVFEVIK